MELYRRVSSSARFRIASRLGLATAVVMVFLLLLAIMSLRLHVATWQLRTSVLILFLPRA